MDFIRTLFTGLGLGNYNTGVVIFGCVLLGLSAGLVGPFMLLRRRALLADATSHAMLPGIAVAFLLMVALGGQGKWLPGLLLGALVSGLLGMLAVIGITKWSRIRQDAALAIVLSVFYGFGVVLLGYIQQMKGGSVAGLDSFILAKTASMVASDAFLIAGVAAGVAVAVWLLYKEFSIVCFDADFAASQGWPVSWIDVAMMILVVVVTVIGLQAVGLILMVALLVTPGAAARFWTHRLKSMLWISGIIGAVGCLLGAVMSASFERVPAGAMMVLCTSAAFLFSMLFGRQGGMLSRWIERRGVRRSVERQHILRAVFEHQERDDEYPTVSEVFDVRTWSHRQLKRALGRFEELVYVNKNDRVVFTEEGLVEARQVVRNHRLWELYLIEHADIAASHVDRDADRIEHVLGNAMVDKLEALLDARGEIPASPHVIRAGDNL